jgi:hypothetical protein
VVLTGAPRFILFAVSEIALAADTVLSRETVAPVEVTDTNPAVEVIFALDPEVVVISPDPERVMFPEAWSAPVGATEVPPVIERFPEVAVKEAEPEYVPVGRMVTDSPEFAPCIETLAPETFSEPLELILPFSVSALPGAERLTAPADAVDMSNCTSERRLPEAAP